MDGLVLSQPVDAVLRLLLHCRIPPAIAYAQSKLQAGFVLNTDHTYSQPCMPDCTCSELLQGHQFGKVHKDLEVYARKQQRKEQSSRQHIR